MSKRHHKYERRDIVKHWIINLMLWCLNFMWILEQQWQCLHTSSTSHEPSRFHKMCIAQTDINKYGRMISQGNYLLFWYNAQKKRRDIEKCILDWRSIKIKILAWKNIYDHHKKISFFFIFFFMNVSIYQIQRITNTISKIIVFCLYKTSRKKLSCWEGTTSYGAF